MVDENTFFREATLRLCSSLEVDQSLARCYAYVSRFIPADAMVIIHLSPEDGGVRILAQADRKGGRKTDQFVPVPPQSMDWATQKGHPPVIIIDRPEEHPIVKFVLKSAKIPIRSLLVIRLFMEGKILGSLSLISGRRNVYHQEHARLLSFLREPAFITLSNHLRYREVLHLKEMLADDNIYLRDELRSLKGSEIVGRDFGLRETMTLIHQVAPLNSPVMLLGETGTGKELMAREIHQLSSRREGPFIKVNCGAIPESLIDSELFGYEKGAFTGARSSKRGRFERAHTGTILLDEIGELPPEVQVRLLRVLQEKEIERVGGERTIKVDIRIIAATHRDLARMVQEGSFREDLYFRLLVFPVHIPPLRERQNDIPALAQYFLQKKAQEMKLPRLPALDPAGLDRLLNYRWPGNVRELENVIERALIVNRGPSLTFSDLPDPGREGVAASSPAGTEEIIPLNAVMASHIRKTLTHCQGRVEGRGGAAELLQINPGTLRHRMRKLGIAFGRKMKKG